MENSMLPSLLPLKKKNKETAPSFTELLICLCKTHFENSLSVLPLPNLWHRH